MWPRNITQKATDVAAPHATLECAIHVRLDKYREFLRCGLHMYDYTYIS